MVLLSDHKNLCTRGNPVMRPGLRQVDLTCDASIRSAHADIIRYEMRLEETRAHHDDIFGLEKVIRASLEIQAFPVDHTLDCHTLGGSKFGKPASECYSLLDGGILFQTIPTRALDLACEVDEGRYRHIDHVAILQRNTLRHPARHQLLERHPHRGLPVCSSRAFGRTRCQSLLVCSVRQNDLKTC